METEKPYCALLILTTVLKIFKHSMPQESITLDQNSSQFCAHGSQILHTWSYQDQVAKGSQWRTVICQSSSVLQWQLYIQAKHEGLEPSYH